LLFGLVEVFDHAGDQPGVVQVLRRIATRRPADAAVWVRLYERAMQIGDAKSAAEARAALVKLEGESGTSVLLCDAASAATAKPLASPVAAFGANPTPPAVALPMARLLVWA